MEVTDEAAELARLRAVERMLTSITAHAPDYMLHFDREGVISYMNRAPPGHRLEDVIGTNVCKWMEPASHEAFGRALEEVFETSSLASYESVGSVTGHYYVNRISPVIVDGRVESAVLITHDITDLKNAERQRAEAEQRYRAMAEALFQGLAILVDGRMTYANRALEAMLGYGPGELVGRRPQDITTPESTEVALRNIRAKVETPYEVVAVRKDGSTFSCEVLGRSVTYDGRPARITGFRDLTDQRRQEADQARREARVQHAQKLETLGVLAGGIAHDFNNLLAVVVCNAELALRTPEDVSKVRECLGQIGAAAQRGSSLTNQLLVYAGQGDPRTEVVDLGEAIEDVGEMLRVSVPKKARVSYELSPELPPVKVDPAQLQQLAMNLIINAAEALPDGSGSIRICTGVTELAAESARCADLHLSPGRYVTLEVSDTGAGMDAATRQRIFDPFFTTKFAGRGLGLAAVQGIVRSHGAAIEVDSEPGKGTCFRVLLPVATEPATGRPASKTPQTSPQTATVLVAEDEPPLASVLQVALEALGHVVLLAEDGPTALQLFRDNERDVDLALLDVTMPGMDGFELLEGLRALAPSLPVVLSSGYSDHARDPRVVAGERVWFLPKPYQLTQLEDAVRRALARSGHAETPR